jgi:hypothetical protein
MSEAKEPAKKIYKPVTQERAKALDLAFTASRLVEEKHFDKVSMALKTDDKPMFIEVCGEAQISPELAETLWEMLRKMFGDIKGFIPW